MGPEYAVIVSRGMRSMLLGLASIAGGFVVLMVWDAVVSGQLSSLASSLQVLVFCVGLGFGLYGAIRFQLVGSRILKDLRERGIEAQRAPDLRGPNSYLAWCVKQNVTPQQVIDTGKAKYGTQSDG